MGLDSHRTFNKNISQIKIKKHDHLHILFGFVSVMYEASQILCDTEFIYTVWSNFFLFLEAVCNKHSCHMYSDRKMFMSYIIKVLKAGNVFWVMKHSKLYWI